MSETNEYGLIGNPLVHSFSEKFFSGKFKTEVIKATYTNFELEDIGELMELIAEHPHLQGFNVTIPYKEQILPYLSEITPEAEEIGAVNVVKIENAGLRDFRLIGYNTDSPAFKETIRYIPGDCERKAIVLGTGGASKAVEKALEALDYTVHKVSRTPSGEQLSYYDLPEIINDYSLIVNTTPLGTFPNVESSPKIPYDKLTARHFCYDLVYNPPVTEFIKKCAERGCAVKNGLEMLHRQALLSWEIWNR